MLRASVSVLVGDGTSARFWIDSWLPDGAICSFAPNLFMAVGCRRRKRTVREALTNHQWARDISGATTAAVLCESPRVADRYIWKWTPSGNYSASSAYRAFFFGMTSLLGAMFV